MLLLLVLLNSAFFFPFALWYLPSIRNDDLLPWLPAVGSCTPLDSIQGIHAVNDFAKDNMLIVQPARFFSNKCENFDYWDW